MRFLGNLPNRDGVLSAEMFPPQGSTSHGVQTHRQLGLVVEGHCAGQVDRLNLLTCLFGQMSLQDHMSVMSVVLKTFLARACSPTYQHALPQRRFATQVPEFQPAPS